MDIKRTAGNPGDNGGELALAVCVSVRFRRFRLISIDTHLWSECDKQMGYREKTRCRKTTSIKSNTVSACRIQLGLPSGDSVPAGVPPGTATPVVGCQTHVSSVHLMVTDSLVSERTLVNNNERNLLSDVVRE